MGIDRQQIHLDKNKKDIYEIYTFIDDIKYENSEVLLHGYEDKKIKNVVDAQVYIESEKRCKASKLMAHFL